VEAIICGVDASVAARATLAEMERRRPPIEARDGWWFSPRATTLMVLAEERKTHG
jgi:hypothetical protein